MAFLKEFGHRIVEFFSRAMVLGNFDASDPSTSVERLFGEPESPSGIAVTEDNALTYAAVFSAVRVLAESESQLPFKVFRRAKINGRLGAEEAFDHRSYRLLHDEPNPENSSIDFRGMLMFALNLNGNGYAEIERDGAGRPKHLWPIEPVRVTPRREGGRIVYSVSASSSSIRPSPATIAAEDMIHVPGPRMRGLKGLSPIGLHREAVALGLSLQAFGSSFFGNASFAGGWLKHPAQLSPEARKRLRESIEARHQGPRNAFRLGLLEEGLEFEANTINPDDAQFLESRRFQISEIARIFRVPPHMLADLERATFSNIEQMSLEFVVYSLSPWLVRIEQEMNRKLFSEGEKGTYYVKHNVAGLLRGEFKAQADALALGRNNGWLSADDIRSILDLNPIGADKGGDLYLVPLNMVPAELAAKGIGAASGSTPRAVASARGALLARRMIDAHEPLLTGEWARWNRRLRGELAGRARAAADVPSALLAILPTYGDMEPRAVRITADVALAAARSACRAVADLKGVELDEGSIETFVRAMVERSVSLRIASIRSEIEAHNVAGGDLPALLETLSSRGEAPPGAELLLDQLRDLAAQVGEESS
jgi:HK97 family phage portal protein